MRPETAFDLKRAARCSPLSAFEFKQIEASTHGESFKFKEIGDPSPRSALNFKETDPVTTAKSRIQRRPLPPGAKCQSAMARRRCLMHPARCPGVRSRDTS